MTITVEEGQDRHHGGHRGDRDRKKSMASIVSEKVVMVDSSHVEYPTSYLETMVHFMKGSVGSGLFAMGDAFRNAGLVGGPVLTLLTGTVCVFAQHQLLTTSQVVSSRYNMKSPPDYAEVVELSFKMGPGPFPRIAYLARVLVNVLICMTQLGFCCVYFLFIATNLKQVLDQYVAPIDVHLYMAMVLVPVLSLTLVRNLKYLAPVSLAANTALWAGTAVTIYESAKDGLPAPTERDLFADWGRVPLFFGTVVFAFEGICIVVPLMNEMKNPDDFRRPLGVMNVSSVVVGAMLVSVGFVGYLRFGDAVESSLTLNLDQTSVICQVVKVGICLAILGTYPLQAYFPADILWRLLDNSFRPVRYRVMLELALRTCVVLFTFLLARFVTKLNLFISLVGALSSSSLAFFFPPLLDWTWRWREGRLTIWRHLVNSFIFVAGILVIGWGSYSALVEIVTSNDHEEG